MDWRPTDILIHFWDGFIFQRLEFCISLQTLAATVLYTILALPIRYIAMTFT